MILCIIRFVSRSNCIKNKQRKLAEKKIKYTTQDYINDPQTYNSQGAKANIQTDSNILFASKSIIDSRIDDNALANNEEIIE